MYNNNGRPLTRRQTLKILILLMLLMWATQTLLAQWSFGQDMKFVAPSELPPAVVELRQEATVQGAEVRLKHIARWSDADVRTLAPAADLVVLRLSLQSPYKTITLAEVKQLLSDAGVNMAAVRLIGATKCTVNRSDVRFNEGEALTKWLDANAPKPQPAPAAVATPLQTPPTIAVAPAPADPRKASEPIKTLRDLLIADLAVRLQLPADTLQMTFAARDERLLVLSEGVFRFTLAAVRARDLGTVIYDVTITNNGTSQKVTVNATARAWQEQVVVARPIPFKAVIREGDVQTKRALVDRLPGDPLVGMSQVVGQQAGRELKPGTVMTAKLVDAVPMVRTGQLVTITYTQGTVQLRSVARALSGGAYGETIRAKNETTGAVFEVVLTGPQTATMNAMPAERGSKLLTTARE
jgi:flagella basal body P-ring formation protein FlgA